jgi:hypothetical protein
MGAVGFCYAQSLAPHGRFPLASSPGEGACSWLMAVLTPRQPVSVPPSHIVIALVASLMKAA